MRLNTELRNTDRDVEVEAGGVLDAGRDDLLGEVEALLVEALQHVPEVVVIWVDLSPRAAGEQHARGPHYTQLEQTLYTGRSVSTEPPNWDWQWVTKV